MDTVGVDDSVAAGVVAFAIVVDAGDMPPLVVYLSLFNLSSLSESESESLSCVGHIYRNGRSTRWVRRDGNGRGERRQINYIYRVKNSF